MKDDQFEREQAMRAEGWRFCHNRSARKHRKQGHEVRYFSGGRYAWRPRYGIWMRADAITRKP